MQIDQPNFGMSSGALYAEGLESPIVRNYTHQIVLIAAALGANGSWVAKEMKEAVALEMELVKIASPGNRRGNQDRMYNIKTLTELKRSYPSVRTASSFSTLLSLQVLQIDLYTLIFNAFPREVEITRDESVCVKELGYYRALQKVWPYILHFSPLFRSGNLLRSGDIICIT